MSTIYIVIVCCAFAAFVLSLAISYYFSKRSAKKNFQKRSENSETDAKLSHENKDK